MVKVKMGEGDPTGTSAMASLSIKYHELVSILGEPNSEGDGYKTDAEWIGTIDGEVFTLYNYKNGVNYNKESGLKTEDIEDWHLGAHSVDVSHKVINYIDDKLHEPKHNFPNNSLKSYRKELK